MRLKTIQRDKAIINDYDDLEYLYRFEKFPVFMGCTTKSMEEDIQR